MKTLNSILLVLVLSPTVFAAAPPLRGLVAYYRFDGSGKNSAGKGLDLVSQDATYRAGRSGQAAYFNGLNDFFQTREDFPITADQSRTISVWLKPDSFSGNANVVGWGSFDSSSRTHDNNGVGRFWGLYLSPPGPGVAHINTHWRLYSSGPFSFEPDSWIHLAVTYKRNTDTIRFYLNGDYIGGSLALGNPTISVNTASAPLHIGFFQPYLSPNTDVWLTTYSGLMDDLRIYNRELSPEEVQSLANTKNQPHTARRSGWRAGAVDNY